MKRMLTAAAMAVSIGSGAATAGGPGTTGGKLDRRPAMAPEHASLVALAPENAALRYWPAIHSLSRSLAAAPEVDLNGYVRRETNTTEAAKTEAWVRSNRDLAGRFVEASRLGSCDFGLDRVEGPSMLIAHLGALRQGGSLLMADARLQLSEGDAHAAAERLAAVFRIARHLPTDRVLISSLVSAAMLKAADGATAEAIASGSMTDADRAIIADALAKFDPTDPCGIKIALAGEKEIFIGWMRANFAGPDRVDAFAHELDSLNDAPRSARLEQALAAAKKGDGLEPQFKLIELWYDEALAMWGTPGAREAMTEMNARVDAGGYGELARVFLPAYHKLLDSWEKSVATLAAARARVGH